MTKKIKDAKKKARVAPTPCPKTPALVKRTVVVAAIGLSVAACGEEEGVVLGGDAGTYAADAGPEAGNDATPDYYDAGVTDAGIQAPPDH